MAVYLQTSTTLICGLGLHQHADFLRILAICCLPNENDIRIMALCTDSNHHSNLDNREKAMVIMITN